MCLQNFTRNLTSTCATEPYKHLRHRTPQAPAPHKKSNKEAQGSNQILTAPISQFTASMFVASGYGHWTPLYCLGLLNYTSISRVLVLGAALVCWCWRCTRALASNFLWPRSVGLAFNCCALTSFRPKHRLS